MSESLLPESVRALARLRGAGMAARLLALACPALVTACTGAAGGDLQRPIVIAVAVLTALSVLHPDTHAGLLVVVLLGVQWLEAVDDHATPWVIPAACCLGVFHASLAAATVAPPAARWTPAMTRRWCRRAAVLALPAAGSWLVVAVLDRHRPAGSAPLLAAALVVLSIGGVWAGTTRRAAPRR